jgi:hypothetical protein
LYREKRKNRERMRRRVWAFGYPLLYRPWVDFIIHGGFFLKTCNATYPWAEEPRMSQILWCEEELAILIVNLMCKDIFIGGSLDKRKQLIEAVHLRNTWKCF